MYLKHYFIVRRKIQYLGREKLPQKGFITIYGLHFFLFSMFFLILLQGVPTQLLAAPNITGVAGTIANGQQITISGSSFGTNGPTVLLFDDFEGGTNGNQLSLNLAPVGTWSGISTADHTSYSNANKVSGSLAARFNIYNYPVNNNPVIWVTAPSAFDSFYVSWWAMLPAGTVFPGTGNPDGTNWKVMWVCKDDACNDADVDLVGLSSTGWALSGNDYPNVYSIWFDFSLSTGVWYRFQEWIKGRTDSTGHETIWTTDSSNKTVLRKDRDVQTLNSGDTNKRRVIFVNGYVRDTANSYPTFDDVYIATGEYAQARVEIGNASTYANCSNLTITTPTSWSDTRIVTTVRQGSFSSGQTAYLYVFDANGNVNSTGFPITIGGKSDNSRPIPPAGVKMY